MSLSISKLCKISSISRIKIDCFRIALYPVYAQWLSHVVQDNFVVMTEAEAYQFENWQLKIGLHFDVDTLCISTLQFRLKDWCENQNSRLQFIAYRDAYRDKRDDGRYDDSEIITVTHRRKCMVCCSVYSFRFSFLKQQILSNHVSLVKLHLFIGINIPHEKFRI